MKVMAHRGYSGVYPENTMLSFREAVKVGCDAIEMDVHETRDGRLVVIHDERLDRTTDGSGRVCDHSFAELQQVNAAACYKGKYAPEHIPSFDEYCEWASGESVGHNIEIKTDKIYYHDIERKIWATIERYGLEKKVMFSSFNHISLRKILEISGNAVEVGALVLEDSIGGFPGYYCQQAGFACYPADRAAHGRKRARLQGARREDERLDRQRHGGSGAAPPLGLRGHHHELPRRGQRLAARAG